MQRTIMLIPIGEGVGLTTVSLGLLHSFQRLGLKSKFFKPISQPRPGYDGPELSTRIVKNASGIEIVDSIPLEMAEGLVSADKKDILLEDIVERHQNDFSDAEVVVVEGLVPTRRHTYATRLNFEIASALNADIVFVTISGGDKPKDLKERVEITYNNLGGKNNKSLLGVIVNKVGAPVDEHGRNRPDLSEMFDDNKTSITDSIDVIKSAFSRSKVPLLGCVPWNFDLIAPRVADLAEHLNAEYVSEGQADTRRLRSVTFCARSIPNMVEHIKPGSLLVSSADRHDVIVAACLSAMNGVEIGALLLTGGYRPDEKILALCKHALDGGLPVLLIGGNTWQTSLTLQNFNLELPIDDAERLQLVQEHAAQYLDHEWLEALSKDHDRKRLMSPPAFRFKLTELARNAAKRIVLPEGVEPRTVRAAAICAERGIARPVLIGCPDEINRVAEQQGITLPPSVELLDPLSVQESYVGPMVELRKHKGLEEVVAREHLQDNVVLGTMMLQLGDVDGLVSGAIHTTANTIRPALQLVKTAPGSSLVSSIFFMLLPEQVLVYGDCAINPDPNAEQLADIAIQSAESAAAFGIDPKVAMISYSTGTSGSGSDVEKVREATRIAKERRPDLVIDGPLQYDAAVMENVAQSKAPDSPVAGQATVFIFPDLNTGNTTYKAVQRSADLISIGPMLQGLNKPVNDLSRGALVEDIVYTIALTAIQATQMESRDS